MHHAVTVSKSLVESLLEEGAHLDALCKQGKTVLLYALEKEEYDSVEYLIEQILKIDRSLLDETDEDGNAPLHWAALKGNERAVKLLLVSGADTKTRNVFGSTPLHCAALGNYSGICTLLITMPDMALRLLDVERSNARIVAALCCMRRYTILPRHYYMSNILF